MTNKIVLNYLIAGTRGGITRAKIIILLRKNALNKNKIAKELKLDYKTVQHHLRVLEKNRIIAVIDKGQYGAAYYIAPEMEPSLHLVDELWRESGEK